MTDHMIPVREAARRFNLAPRVLLEALKRDKVAIYWPTKRTALVREADLEAWMERKRGSGTGGVIHPVMRPPSERRKGA